MILHRELWDAIGGTTGRLIIGFALATVSMGAFWTHAGFGLLAVVWLFTTIRAVRLARLGHFRDHQNWMTRSFALTLAAVTLRIYLPLLASQMSFLTAYLIVSWVCWVPNLLAAEWLVATRGSRINQGALRAAIP